MRVWRSSFSLILVVVLTLYLASGAYAKQPKTTRLSADAHCYVQLDQVELVSYSDDEVAVRVKDHVNANEGPMSFVLEVDPAKNTYKTIKNEKANLESPIGMDAVELAASTKSRTVRITTMDPAYIDLCKTWLKLTWTYDGSRVTSSSRSKGAWDACPSPLGTDWYLIYNNYGTFFKEATYVHTSTNAKHENWDFGVNDKGTWAYHYIWDCGYGDGSFDYNISFKHTGEGASLLMAMYDVY